MSTDLSHLTLNEFYLVGQLGLTEECAKDLLETCKGNLLMAEMVLGDFMISKNPALNDVIEFNTDCARRAYIEKLNSMRRRK